MYELTFLLCKPDAELVHQEIIQTVVDAGFTVKAKSYQISDDIAMEVAKFSPVDLNRSRGNNSLSVEAEGEANAARWCKERQHSKGTTQAEAEQGSGEGELGPRSTHRLTATSSEAKNSEEKVERFVSASTKVLISHSVRDQFSSFRKNMHFPSVKGRIVETMDEDESHAQRQRLLVDIKRLLSSRSGASKGTGRNLHASSNVSRVLSPCFSSDARGRNESQVLPPLAAGTEGAGFSLPHSINLRPDMPGSPVGFSRCSFGTLGDTNDRAAGNHGGLPSPKSLGGIGSAGTQTNVENTGWGEEYEQETLAAHVHHLALGGTCVAVLLAAPNAIARLAALSGPDNPAVARKESPGSLRARFGTDLVRNAVHVPHSQEEALELIPLLFGTKPWSYHQSKGEGVTEASFTEDCLKKKSVPHSADGKVAHSLQATFAVGDENALGNGRLPSAVLISTKDIISVEADGTMRSQMPFESSSLNAIPFKLKSLNASKPLRTGIESKCNECSCAKSSRKQYASELNHRLAFLAVDAIIHPWVEARSPEPLLDALASSRGTTHAPRSSGRLPFYQQNKYEEFPDGRLRCSSQTERSELGSTFPDHHVLPAAMTKGKHPFFAHQNGGVDCSIQKAHELDASFDNRCKIMLKRSGEQLVQPHRTGETKWRAHRESEIQHSTVISKMLCTLHSGFPSATENDRDLLSPVLSSPAPLVRAEEPVGLTSLLIIEERPFSKERRLHGRDHSASSKRCSRDISANGDSEVVLPPQGDDVDSETFLQQPVNFVRSPRLKVEDIPNLVTNEAARRSLFCALDLKNEQRVPMKSVIQLLAHSPGIAALFSCFSDPEKHLAAAAERVLTKYTPRSTKPVKETVSNDRKSSMQQNDSSCTQEVDETDTSSSTKVGLTVEKWHLAEIHLNFNVFSELLLSLLRL